MAKEKLKTFRRSSKEWQHSISEHIGKFIDKIEIKDILELLGFIGVFLTYYLWEEDDRPITEVLKYTLPQAALDYLLLKTGTEAGTIAALTHIGARGLIEVMQNVVLSEGGIGERFMERRKKSLIFGPSYIG